MYKILSLSIFATLFFMGCSSKARIYEPVAKPIVTTKEKATKQDITEAIIRAAKNKKWTVVSKSNNQIILNYAKHEVTISVSYTMDNYSIHLVSAGRLGKKDSCIHKSYNKWIKALETEIAAQL